jgi:hypothetical protein
MKNTSMKTNKTVSRIKFGIGAAFALAMAASLPVTTQAADPMKGGPHMKHLMGIKTEAEAEALKPGDTIAMVCSKCTSVMTHNITTEKGHIMVMSVGEKHLCPGCNSTITVVGTGKGKHDAVKHTCGKCGDDSVFCCATKPGAGATKGMEKEKK